MPASSPYAPAQSQGKFRNLQDLADANDVYCNFISTHGEGRKTMPQVILRAFDEQLAKWYPRGMRHEDPALRKRRQAWVAEYVQKPWFLPTLRLANAATLHERLVARKSELKKQSRERRRRSEQQVVVISEAPGNDAVVPESVRQQSGAQQIAPPRPPLPPPPPPPPSPTRTTVVQALPASTSIRIVEPVVPPQVPATARTATDLTMSAIRTTGNVVFRGIAVTNTEQRVRRLFDHTIYSQHHDGFTWLLDELGHSQIDYDPQADSILTRPAHDGMSVMVESQFEFEELIQDTIDAGEEPWLELDIVRFD